MGLRPFLILEMGHRTDANFKLRVLQWQEESSSSLETQCGASREALCLVWSVNKHGTVTWMQRPIWRAFDTTVQLSCNCLLPSRSADPTVRTSADRLSFKTVSKATHRGPEERFVIYVDLHMSCLQTTNTRAFFYFLAAWRNTTLAFMKARPWVAPCVD